MNGQSDICQLHHPAFGKLGHIVFRRTHDGAAVMAMSMGERQATIPLRALQREWGIADDSHDGRMLRLIVDALDFVSTVHPGDRMPAEVLSGKASWRVGDHHRAVAAARVQRQLVDWLVSFGGTVASVQTDVDMRNQLQDAMSSAARSIGLAGPNDVLTLIEGMTDELAYIEALRDTFLRRVTAMVAKIAQFAQSGSRDQTHHETMVQVQRLSRTAHVQLRTRFAEVDDQTAAVLSALRNVDRHRAFVRSNRDWLYRTSRAWAALLDEWARAGTVLDDAAWGLLARTYQFLAPRYMPMTEWPTGRRAQPRSKIMTW